MFRVLAPLIPPRPGAFDALVEGVEKVAFAEVQSFVTDPVTINAQGLAPMKSTVRPFRAQP